MMGAPDIKRAGQDVVSVADNICSDFGWPMDNTFCLETTAVNVGEYSIYRKATRWFHDPAKACCSLGSVDSVNVGIFHYHFYTYRASYVFLNFSLREKRAIGWFSGKLHLCHE